MLDREAKAWLGQRFAGRVLFDELMSRHTSFRIGGPAEAMVFPETREDAAALLVFATKHGIPCLTVGGGTNLLVADGGISGIVMSLTQGLSEIRVLDREEGRVWVDAGVSLKGFCRYAMGAGLSGMNFALGIPGTIGGAIRMNAGTAAGWMSDRLLSIDLLAKSGTVVRVPGDKLHGSYRDLAWESDQGGEVILGGLFTLVPSSAETLREEACRIWKQRSAIQPRGRGAGCFFRNPSMDMTAGRLIDQAGLKGARRGGAMVSEQHANFILNQGDATARDVFDLVEVIQKTVFDQFGVMLKPEVRFAGTE